jgi:hypothetical protein
MFVFIAPLLLRYFMDFEFLRFFPVLNMPQMDYRDVLTFLLGEDYLSDKTEPLG